MSTSTTFLITLLQRPLLVIDADTTVAAALCTARSHGIHHLPVSRRGTLVGLVCTCNLRAASPRAGVSTVMSSPAVTLDATASFSDAVSVMNAFDVGSIVVLQDHLPCGIVTRGDLLSADPGLERRFAKSRCQCCGLTRHLRTMADGATLCVYCSEPGTDAEINHISAE